NGFGPFVPGITWFNIYWLLFAAILSLITLFFWMRGKEQSFSFRLRNGRQSFSGRNKMMIAGFIILWVITGGFVFYNTKVINHFDPPKTAQEKQVDYEKKYKRYEKVIQPRVVDIKYKIDLFPEERKMNATGNYVLKNKSAIAIDSLFFTIPVGMEVAIDIPGSKLLLDDKELNFRIYTLPSPLQP